MPSRHLAAVLVTDNAFGLVGIEVVLDVADFLCCLPLLSGISIEVGHVVAGFVSVGIHADQTADVCRSMFAHVAFGYKERIQLAHKAFVAAHQVDEAFGMLGHEESIVPAVALAEVAPTVNGLEGIVGRTPTTVVHLRTDEVDALVEILLIIVSALQEGVVDVLLAHLLRHHGQSPVAYSILHGDRSGFRHLVAGNPTFFQHVRHAALLLVRGRSNHSVQSTFGVKAFEAFQISVGNDGDGAVARHLIGFASHQRPDRQLALLVVDAQHGVYHVGHQLRLDDGK